MNVPEDTLPKPLTFSLLRLLSDGEFHSGEILAHKLGVSRTSVSNALKRVDQYGLTIFSVKGRGYRLLDAPQWLEVDKIKANLNTPEIFQIELSDTAPSTNTILMKGAVSGAARGSVYATEWQSAGRGRLGRAWHTGLGKALTFSVLWRFDFGLSALSGLSLVVGIAMMRALSKLDVTGVGLKWPNDLLNNQGKIAGILIEAQGDMLGPSLVVIGIGLNWCLPQTIVQRIDQPVSDLAHVKAALPERNHLLATLLQELANIMSEFAQQGFKSLRAEWERYHLYQNRRVIMSLPDGTGVIGVVRGVTDEGALRVETTKGMQIFNAGEISLREA